MSAVRILCIETALSGCSVCLVENENILAQSISCIPNSASDKLHELVAEVLEKSDLQLKDIQAIAVSNGPGSYTGLRIGVAAAKGYAYALHVPIIAISTLQIMAAAVKYRYHISADYYIPAIDARRNEIFLAMFDKNLNACMAESPLIMDHTTKKMFDQSQKNYLFGSGAQKLFDMIQLPDINILPDLELQAQDMKILARTGFLNKKFADPAYLEPNYTKEFYLLQSHIKKN
jgi:tRNA threonylcarbamoyladenosine biosynthesis protein TsaB